MLSGEIFWNTETSPDGGVILYRSKRHENLVKLETSQTKRVLKGTSNAAVIIFLLLYVSFIGGCLMALTMWLYEDLVEGPGLILLILIELPLLVGAVLPLTHTTYAVQLRPLFITDSLELDEELYMFRRIMPKLVHWLYYGNQADVRVGGIITEFMQCGLLVSPPGTVDKAFLMPGLDFGCELSIEDAKFVCAAVHTHLRQMNVVMEEESADARVRKVPVPTILYQSTSSGDISVDFPGEELWKKAVGFMSLWALPFTIGVPLVYYSMEANDRGRGEADRDYILPMVVWGLLHAIMYAYWVLHDLLAVRLTYSSGPQVWEFSHHLFVIPGIRVPVLVMDGWTPRLKLYGRKANLMGVTREPVILYGREVAQRIALQFSTASDGQKLAAVPIRGGSSSSRFLLPSLEYHETLWLQQQIQATWEDNWNSAANFP